MIREIIDQLRLDQRERGTGVRATGWRMGQITQSFKRQPNAQGFLMRGLEENIEALLLTGATPGDIFEVVANALQAQADKQQVYISQLGSTLAHAELRHDLLTAEFGDMQVFTRAAMAAEDITQAEVDDAADAKLQTLLEARNSGALSENYKYGTPYKRRKN